MKYLLLIVLFLSCTTTKIEKTNFIVPDNRVILNGQINQHSAINFGQQLDAKIVDIYLKKSVNVTISSTGGYLMYTDVIINMFKKLKKEKIKINCLVTLAYSGGMDILNHCDSRYALKHSKFMQHGASCRDSSGKTVKCNPISKFIQDHRRFKSMSKRTGLTLDFIFKKTKKKDWFFNSKEALKLNVIDKIID